MNELCKLNTNEYKTLTVEKSDEFDECMLNHQNFPTKILHLENFGIAYFYGYNLLTRVCHVVAAWNLDHPITHKKDASEDKDPPEGKE